MGSRSRPPGSKRDRQCIRRSGRFQPGRLSVRRMWISVRVVLQRVTEASVFIDGAIVGTIGRGFLLLVGASDEDTMEIADKMTDKICKLRIFADGNGKTNLSLADVGGELLVVSQFTLYADCRRGNRPGFTGAGAPDWANQIYEHVIERCRGYVSKVEHGVFGADMEVKLVNDGPFTLVLDSKELGIG